MKVSKGALMAGGVGIAAAGTLVATRARRKRHDTPDAGEMAPSMDAYPEGATEPISTLTEDDGPGEPAIVT
jgi:hypothetical protein